MESCFISGIDTDVGKTIFTAGLARVLSNKKINVGVMKPFAAQDKSDVIDSEILASAARVNDSKELINPQFFPISASPFTASENLKIKIDLDLIKNSYEILSKRHPCMLVEGMGGIMTPILENYYMVDLASDLNLDVIILTRTKIGSINHTLMTVQMCKKFNVKIKGIIINDFDSDGYPALQLKRDLENLTQNKILGILPKLTDLSIDGISKSVLNVIDLF